MPRHLTPSRTRSLAAVCAFLFLASAPRVAAQQMELGALGAWQFGGSLDTDDGKIGLDPAIGWGGYLDFWVRPDGLGEVLYQRQSTTLTLAQPPAPADSLFELTVHYLHLGGLYEPAQGVARPFGGATAGITLFDPFGTNRSSVTRFSMSFVGGGKVYLGSRIGIRGEGRIFLNTFADETELFCRLPGGCFISTTGQVLVQLHGAVSAFIRF